MVSTYLQVAQAIEDEYLPIPAGSQFCLILTVRNTHLNNRVDHDIEHLIETRVDFALVFVP